MYFFETYPNSLIFKLISVSLLFLSPVKGSTLHFPRDNVPTASSTSGLLVLDEAPASYLQERSYDSNTQTYDIGTLSRGSDESDSMILKSGK